MRTMGVREFRAGFSAGAYSEVIKVTARGGTWVGTFYPPNEEFPANITTPQVHALEKEVRHLKEELAKRPTSAHGVGHEANADAMIVVADSQYGQRFNTRPFTPVPKKGH